MGKISGFFVRQKNYIIEIYKKYMSTIAAVILLTIIFVIFNHIETNDFYKHSISILLLYSAWSLFFETYYYNKNQTLIKRLVTLGIGILISVILDIIYQHIIEINPNYGYTAVEINIILFIYFYIIFLIGGALYILIKRQKISFHEYLARVVFGLLRAAGLFLTLFIAVVLLLELYDNLIASIDYWDVFEDIEIIISGLIYFPVCLVTLVKTEEENSKFTKGVVTYAFMPCVMIAMIIIYIYIIKIFVTWQIPSNEIFSICACLFVICAPIWTMAYAFTCEKNNIYAKLIKYMKYIYAPFLFLEIYAIAVRMKEYGITESRYAGVAFIIFQIIYILWELILKLFRKIQKKEKQPVYGKYYEYMILVIVAIAFIGFVIPGINATYVSYLSQKKIFKNHKESNVSAACEAYYYLKDNPYGKNWLDKNCTKEELAELQKQYYDKTKDKSILDWKYVYIGNDKFLYYGLDISGYNTLYKVTCGYSNRNYTNEECKSVAVRIDDKDTFNIDLTDCLLYYAEINEEPEQYSDEDKIYCMDIDENHRLYIYNVHFSYIEGMAIIKNLSINGYLLER